MKQDYILVDKEKLNEIYSPDSKIFQSHITNFINKQKGNYSVYVKDLKDNETIEAGTKKIYRPASTFKLFTAALILKDIEENKISLETTLKLPAEDDEIKYVSIENLMQMMLTYSDNESQSAFFNYLKRENINERISKELNIHSTKLDPFETDAKGIALLLEKIYKADLLNVDHSDLLIKLMLRSSTKNRIKAGIPEKIKVANKIGTLDKEIHDAGIVFGQENDYIIVILSDQIKYAEAIQNQALISEGVWLYFKEKYQGTHQN